MVPLGLELAAPRRRRCRAACCGARPGFPRTRRSWGWWAGSCRSRTCPPSCGPRGSCASARPDVRFALVGDGEERAALERAAASSGSTARCTFFGWRRDLAAVYGDLDVVVNASRNEGTPVALIEALAAARPVVATRGRRARPTSSASDERGRLVPAGRARGARARPSWRRSTSPRPRAARAQAGREHVLARTRRTAWSATWTRSTASCARRRRRPDRPRDDRAHPDRASSSSRFALCRRPRAGGGVRSRAATGCSTSPGPRKVHATPTPAHRRDRRLGRVHARRPRRLLRRAASSRGCPGSQTQPRAARRHAAGGVPRRGEAAGAAARRRDRLRAWASLDDVLGNRFKVGFKLAGQVARRRSSSSRAGSAPTSSSTSWLNVALTLVWVVGITNAFNLLDNMDGLSRRRRVRGVAWCCSQRLAPRRVLHQPRARRLHGEPPRLPRLQLAPGLDLPRRLRQPLHRLHASPRSRSCSATSRTPRAPTSRC